MTAFTSFITLAIALSVAASPIQSLKERAPLKVLIGNDDGWAEANVRAFYNSITGAGYNTLLSCPAENKSGSSSISTTPTPRTSPCEFDSCPKGSPAEGHDASDDRLWYVNAFPSDGITYALSNLATTYLGGAPDIILTGPNVGTNTGLGTLFSGTIGAAVAGSNAGISSVAFSAKSGDQRSYTELVAGDYSDLYAQASLKFTQALVATAGPYVPSGTIVNVNYPAAGAGTGCASLADFKFVFARNTILGTSITTCGKGTLPTEDDVIKTSGCYASVSVLSASSKGDSSKANQQLVFNRLSSILSCRP